jgi:hypothetical protein
MTIGGRVLSQNDRAAGNPNGPDHLPIPHGSKIPAADTARSTRADYDAYFNLVRTNPGLVQWSRSCMSVLGQQRLGMDASQLSLYDRLRILDGANVVLQILLEKWLDAAFITDEQAE